MRRTIAAYAGAGALVGAMLLVPLWRASELRAQSAPPLEAYTLVDVWQGPGAAVPPGHLLEPAGVAIGADGTIYVADVRRDRVVTFRGDRFASVIGRPGSGKGELRRPHGVAVLDGRVLVADTGNRRVQLFEPDGRFVAEWTGLGAPWGAAVTADGRVLVSDRDGDRILVLDRGGNLLDTLGASGTAPGKLDGPTGVAALSGGRLAIVDAGNRRVQVWNEGGMVWGVITSTTLLPQVDVAALGPGKLLVAELRTLLAYDIAQMRPVASSRAPVPGGFAGIASTTGPTGVLTPTVWAGLRSGDLSGLRRYDGEALQAPVDFVALPSPAGELDSPQRIVAAPSGVHVMDAYPRVQRFTVDGLAVEQRLVLEASELAVSPSATFVAGADAVRRLDGVSETWQWSSGPTAWIGALAFDARGDRVLALDLPHQAIVAIDPSGAAAVTHTVGTGEYQAITDMETLPDGRVALVNRSRGEIEVREADGRLGSRWPVRGVPMRLAAGNAGETFVLTREGWVWRLDANGQVRAWWDAGEQAADADRRGAPSDLAVTADGRVLVTDARGDRVLVYAADPAARPPLPPTGSGCNFVRDKWARPTHLNLGQTTGVTLTVSGQCTDEGRGADVMLVIDRSGSMQGQKMAAARAAAIAFVGEINFDVSRVGVVAFSTDATQPIGLSGSASDVVAAIVGIAAPIGGTDIGEAIDLAALELTRTGRAGAERIVIVMSDGRPEGVVVDADGAARAAKAAGLRLFTIGFGGDVDPELMRRMATSPEDYYFAPGAAELAGIYAEIARRITGEITMRTTVITDVVPVNMEYVAGSAVPPAAFAGRELRWELANVRSGLQLAYRLRPLEVGRWPTNVTARARYVDGHDVPGELEFPIPYVTVVGPALPIYLPFAARRYCAPSPIHADVVLVLDTSSSMAGEKLVGAKDAAKLLVDALLLPDDRAAIVTFNRDARLVLGLTGSRSELHAAIDGLDVVQNTAIDAGLRAGSHELLTAGRAEATHVIVLMTDGLNNEGPRPVLAAAADARAAGIILYTVAYGRDADVDLMRAAAGRPDRTFVALTADDLKRIYGEIAGFLPCP